MTDTEKTETLQHLMDVAAGFVKHHDDEAYLKKICNTESTEIKKLMSEIELSDFTVDGYKLSTSTAVSESFDEDSMIKILKAYEPDSPHIRTKEVIDWDSLESAIYADKLPKEVLLDLNKCKTTKETVKLLCKKVKETKDE